jgi:hypothetical protein
VKIHNQLGGVQYELTEINVALTRIAYSLERMVAVAELVTLPLMIAKRLVR